MPIHPIGNGGFAVPAPPVSGPFGPGYTPAHTVYNQTKLNMARQVHRPLPLDAERVKIQVSIMYQPEGKTTRVLVGVRDAQ